MSICHLGETDPVSETTDRPDSPKRKKVTRGPESKEIEFLVRNPPGEKSPSRVSDRAGKSKQQSHTFFRRAEEETLCSSFYETGITLIPELDEESPDYRPVSSFLISSIKCQQVRSSSV